MADEEVINTLKNLSGGEKVRIHPDTSSFHTSNFQPEEPFETKVKHVRKKTNRRDNYLDKETGTRKELDSTEHEIVFETHPDDDGDAEEYYTYYKRFMDGHESIGTVLSRHYFQDNGKRHSAEGGSGFDIERIEVLQDQREN